MGVIKNQYDLTAKASNPAECQFAHAPTPARPFRIGLPIAVWFLDPNPRKHAVSTRELGARHSVGDVATKLCRELCRLLDPIGEKIVRKNH